MEGGVHMLAGALTGISLSGNPAGIFASAAGALLPDIDTSTSALGRRLPFVSLVTGGHRGWTHSLAGLVLFSFPLLFIFGKDVAAAFAAGYLSHLLLDMLNPAGVRMLWPVPLTLRFCSIPSKSLIWNSVLTIILGIALLLRQITL